MIWFEKGQRFDYTGTRNKDELVQWVKDEAKKKNTGDADDASKDDKGKPTETNPPAPKKDTKEEPNPNNYSQETLARIKMLKNIVNSPDSTDD